MKVSSTGKISRRHVSLIVDDNHRTSPEHPATTPRPDEGRLLPIGREEARNDGLQDGWERALRYMKELSLPLTRETYLALAYPEGVPDPLSPEDEARIPPGLE
jgi:hypothetical protein